LVRECGPVGFSGALAFAEAGLSRLAEVPKKGLGCERVEVHEGGGVARPCFPGELRALLGGPAM
jgi:hypothetical protein